VLCVFVNVIWFQFHVSKVSIIKSGDSVSYQWIIWEDKSQ